MKKILTIGLLAIAATAYATDSRIRRFPTDISCQLWDICFPPERLTPIDPHKYDVPRSVGVNLQAVDLSEGPIPWWSAQADQGKPNWMNAAWVRDEFGITAMAFMLAAHPWDNFYENIRKLFRLLRRDLH